MLKKLLPFLIIGMLISVIVIIFLSLAKNQNMTVIHEGNLDRLPIAMKLNKYQDSDCGMVIDNLIDASEVISPSLKTYFFHDHGGMVNWLSTKEFKDEAVIWVKSRDSKKFIDARVAHYSIDDITPMGNGFGAYELKKNNLISFDEMSLKMLRGENMNNPLIKKQLQGR